MVAKKVTWIEQASKLSSAAQSAAKYCGNLVKMNVLNKQERLKLFWYCMKYYKYNGKVPDTIEALKSFSTTPEAQE